MVRRGRKPSRRRALRIASFLALKSKTSDSFAKDIRRLVDDAHANSTSSSTCACVRTVGRPNRFLGVARASSEHAPPL
jgi:hypothetical protein